MHITSSPPSSHLLSSHLHTQFILPSIYLIITYFLLNLPHSGARFFRVWLILVLHTQVAQAFAVVIGAAAPSLPIAVFLGAMSSIPTILFCGFFIVINDIKPFFRWLTYVSYIRYSFEGLVIGLFSDLELDQPSFPTFAPNANSSAIDLQQCQGVLYYDGNAVLARYGFDNSLGEYGFMVLILCMFWVAFKVLAYIILRNKGKRVY